LAPQVVCSHAVASQGPQVTASEPVRHAASTQTTSGRENERMDNAKYLSTQADNKKTRKEEERNANQVLPVNRITHTLKEMLGETKSTL
jgi:hypothetical protein